MVPSQPVFMVPTSRGPLKKTKKFKFYTGVDM
jgi:hypothetical protein